MLSRDEVPLKFLAFLSGQRHPGTLFIEGKILNLRETNVDPLGESNSQKILDYQISCR